MSAEPRAVIFDLDDTLYRERRYALSGFRQIAEVVSMSCDVEAGAAFVWLATCLKQGQRARAFQVLCERLGYPAESVPALVEIFRQHAPALRLPPSSLRTLARMRGTWRIGIVTNGYPDVQRRKVSALDLASQVDEIVCASEHGTGVGKPEAAPFLAVANRLCVEPSACVFVGDDPIRDVWGARAVGMHTIRIDRLAASRSMTAVADDADAVTNTIESVPRLAAALLGAPAARERRNSKCA